MMSRAGCARANACAPAVTALLPRFRPRDLTGRSAVLAGHVLSRGRLLWEGCCGQRKAGAALWRPDRLMPSDKVTKPMKYRCAVLDDYQNVALSYADWSKVTGDVEVKVFDAPFKSTDEVHRSLQGFQIIAMMRERTPFLRNTIEALPDLKLLITTGAGNKSIDLAAAAEHGITVCGTGTFGNPTTGI